MCFRAALLASTALVASALLFQPAAAQDATWAGTTGDLIDGNNWIGGTVPTGTATFGGTGTTALVLQNSGSMGGWAFTAGASNYAVVLGSDMTFTGSGISVVGGSVAITNNSSLNFNSGTAGSSFITNTFVNSFSFWGSSTAGNATVVNDGHMFISDAATAGNAVITNNYVVYFYNDATAGNASITNTNNSAQIGFVGHSTGGNAAIINGGASKADFSESSGPNGDHKLSAGSLAGGGFFHLGANQLTVGGNNLSTSVDGIIADGGPGGGGSGASLVKIGTGTMELSGNNTYSGGTTFAGGAISVSSDANLGAASGGLTFTGGTLQTTASFSSARNIALGTGGGILQVDTGTLELTGDISDSGATPGGLTKRGAGTLLLSGSSNSYTGLTDVQAGTLQLGPGGMLRMDSRHNVAAGATLDLNGSLGAIGSLTGAGTVTTSGGDARLITAMDNTTATFSGTIKDGAAGTVEVWIGGFGSIGTAIFTGANTYSGGTIICECATLQIGNGGTTGSISGDVDNGGTLIFNRSNAYTFAGIISDSVGTGKVIQAGSGTTTLTGVNSYAGGTFVNAGTLALAGAGTLGAASGTTTVAGGTLDLGGTTQTQNSFVLTGGAIINGTLASATTYDLQDGTVGAALSGSAGLAKSGTGRVNLTGISTYTGATVINAGTLSVNGDITASSGVTVNASGTLGGNGRVGNTTFNGGTLAPGNSIGLLTVAGNLVLSSATIYMVEVSTTGSDRVNVTDTANLGGATVNASFAPGSYVSKQYTILNAAGGLGNTSFNTFVITNLPTNFNASLSYDSANAYLDLKLNFGIPAVLNGNQTNVGGALTGYFNRTGGIPLDFAQLSASGLTQASGEVATGSQQATFNAMNLFLGVMTDPFTAGRSGAAPSEALGYASDTRKKSPRDAFGLITKAPPPAPALAASWNMWTAGFGGSQTTDGHATLGSNGTTSRAYGFAVGADYLWAPQTVAGFALSGGGTTFSVANGGTGSSDMFQAGAYVRHTTGSVYLSAAAAYGWQDITTDRTVTAVGFDRLRGRFHANAFSGRIELGNRFVDAWAGGIGLTPYAAVQVTAIDLPAYAESVAAGTGSFALSYAAKAVTAPRTELGLRSDKAFALDGALLTLRGRAAWAHDTNTDRNAQATFQALPGASFTVSGASASRNAALTSASAEVAWLNGFSLAATFEGEFSDTTRSYAGKGVVRYAW